ncbi:MAG TPA: hypothetical protein VFX51_20930 [Solirubrobacteraceae bacterium]|nr:hypothetical protein [Solirubrobacteraceae bacterium]
MSVHAQRLDDVVHFLEVRGAPAAGELERLIDAALTVGCRWLIVDLERAQLSRAVEAPLAAAGHLLRTRRGELILVSASPAVADRVSARDVANRPALAADIDQALMILQLLRPKAAIRRPRKRITSITLPAVEPPATA